MSRARVTRGIALFAVIASVSACASRDRVRGRIDALQTLLGVPGHHVLRACAPRELAIAESHLRFARMELDEGNEPRAAEHVAVAEPNVRAARWLSSPERCAAAAPPPGSTANALDAGARLDTSADVGTQTEARDADTREDAVTGEDAVTDAASGEARAHEEAGPRDAGSARDSDD